MEKIKENGSLYAVPSTNENSSITEMKELVANMAPVIAKPEKLFKEQEISELYELMKPQIQKVRDEEEKERKVREAKKKSLADQSSNPKRNKKIEIDSDYTEVLSEQFDNFEMLGSVSKSNHVPMTIKRVEKKKPLAMGKKTVVLENTLSESEKQKLKALVKDKTQEIYTKIQEEYPDDYNKTIMMDDEVT